MSHQLSIEHENHERSQESQGECDPTGPAGGGEGIVDCHERQNGCCENKKTSGDVRLPRPIGARTDDAAVSLRSPKKEPREGIYDVEFVTDGDWGLRAAGHFSSFPSNQSGMLCCHVNTTQNLLLKLHSNLVILCTT